MYAREPMTVGELIAKLSEFDPQQPIFVGDVDHHAEDARYVLIDDETGLLMITPTDN